MLACVTRGWQVYCPGLRRDRGARRRPESGLTWPPSPVLYCTVLYCTVLYCTVLYCTVLYCTVLYCTVLTVLYTRCLAIGMEPALLQGRRPQQEQDTVTSASDADKGEHGGSEDVSEDGDTLRVKTDEIVTTDLDIMNLLSPDSPDTSISKAKTEPQFEEEEDTKPESVMVMVGPYMSLTVEEQKLLAKLVSDTQVLHIIYINISTIPI